MPHTRQLGSATDSLALAARLFALAADPKADETLAAAVAREAVGLCRAPAAVLVERREDDEHARATPADGPALRVPVAALGAVHDPAPHPDRLVCGPRAQELAAALACGGRPAGALLLIPLPDASCAHRTLVLAGAEDHLAAPELRELARALACTAAAAFAHRSATGGRRRATTSHAALARAARGLNASLDLATLLGRICEEATALVDADAAAVYRVTEEGDLLIEAAHNLPPEHLGFPLPAGQGLAGRVLLAGRPMLVEDYGPIRPPVAGAPWQRTVAALAVPVHWGAQLRGVLSVAHWRPARPDQEDLEALTAFAELAAVAFDNASVRAKLARAALTDPLTGCLNHAALHESLEREIERAGRTDAAPLSLVLFDLDHFKAVNDEHGHLLGDEVLRRTGHALRATTRRYDSVARHGGDEFALIAVEADEEQAREVAERALERLTLSLDDLEGRTGPHATAGVAEWSAGLSAGDLLARADRALVYAKRAGRRGEVLTAAELPPTFLLGRAERRDRRLPAAHAGLPAWRPQRDDEVAERLRRRTRQLGLANQLGAQLAAMSDPAAILETTVEELHGAFGFYLCAVVRLRDDGQMQSIAGRGEAFERLSRADWAQPAGDGVIGRCLRLRRPVRVRDVRAEADYTVTAHTLDVRSELVVPLWVDGALWGAINVEEVRPDAFDEDDERLLGTVADQVGAALRSALLYEQLEHAHRRTEAALAELRRHLGAADRDVLT